MVQYKSSEYLQQNNSIEFDKMFHPGNLAVVSGIYICLGCKISITTKAGHHLPLADHHQHTADQGAIRWELVASSTHP